jgi:Family of unknown function (DUF5758)
MSHGIIALKQPSFEGPLMHYDKKFVMNVESLKPWVELVQNILPVQKKLQVDNNPAKCPPISSEVKKALAWRYWTQQTRAEFAKYKRSPVDGDLDIKFTKSIKHGEVKGMWYTYYLKDVPSAPFLERVQIIRSGMGRTIEFCFPSFLRAHFIEAHGEEFGMNKDMLAMDCDNTIVTDDLNDEYYTPELKARFTPAGWNTYDAPRNYEELEECEKFVTNDSKNDDPVFDNWHPNVRGYGHKAHEVKHLWGNVYELTMIYTYGSSDGTEIAGQGGSKVTSTSKVNSTTGKIISVRVNTGDGFDGDIDDNNKLKVLTDQFTPDGYVYGFKVAKTMKGAPCIVKLMIPRGAKIACNVNDTKLRVDTAWVVGIFKYDYDEHTKTVKYGDQISVARSFYYKEKVASGNAPEFLYRVGDQLTIHNFNPDLGSVCVPGIHFFFSQKQLFHLIQRDVTHWRTEPQFIKGYKQVLGLKFQSRSDIIKKAFQSD